MKRSVLLRYLVLVLSFAMLISLFACDGGNETPTGTERGSGDTESDNTIETDETDGNDVVAETETDGDTLGIDDTADVTSDESETVGDSGAETFDETYSDTSDETESDTNEDDTRVENEDGYEPYDKILYLSIGSMVVRVSPSLDSESVAILNYADRIDIVAHNNLTGWYKVELANGCYGYIASNGIYYSETAPTFEESESGNETESEEDTECYHPYAATQEGHYKPACDICGKGVGKTQSHEYEERIDDGGDLWLYSFRCKICKYVAYEQEVPYEINAFYAPGELSGVDTDRTFSGSFDFEMGTGYALFTMGSGGSGTVKVVDTEDTESESGSYMVMKVRLPSSQNGFSVTVRSIAASGSYVMKFGDLKPGWVTVIVDMTKAISVNSDGNGTGYSPNANGEYYLAYLGINGRVLADEHFDVAYVMICDTLAEAESFTANEKQVYIYSDIANSDPLFLKRDCTDKDGNPIKHTFVSDENGHTVTEPCYQCGLAAANNEPHTYTQMRVEGELTYACSICEYLQYGALINKIFFANDVNANAITYYKVTRELIEEDGFSYARIKGVGETAQVIFARNNYASSEKEEAAAFPIGKGDIFIIRMRTNAPSVTFALNFRTEGGVEKSFELPLTMTEADGWATYVVDLSAVIPDAFVADANGEYNITSLYYQIGTYSVKNEDGTKTGADFTSDVYYDVDFMAFVDDWNELKTLVTDETVIKVNATNVGAVVNTQKQECLGEHMWGEEIDGTMYAYSCANCGTPLKTVEVPSFVKKYFSGYEVARSAKVYAIAGTRSVGLDDDLTLYGRVNGCAEIWWSRHQQDYKSATGASLDNRYMDVGQSRYLVFRLRAWNSEKNFEFYISTTGKNGDGYSVADDGTVTKPTTNGFTTITTPIQASTAGEWTTYVLDLETLIPEYYIKDAETGTYIIDTFAIPFSLEVDMDIEFMAFVEGGWAEIDALTPDETVIYATHKKDKTYSVLRASDGECVNCAYAYGVVQNDDESVTYEFRCSVCGSLAASHNVPTCINKYYALDGITKYSATDNGIIHEEGVVYHSYSIEFGSTGQIFINGSNGYTEMDNDTGNLLVFKYRSSGDATISVEVGTEDRNVIGSWGTEGSVDSDISVSRPAAMISTDWCVAVIDLSVFNYTVDSSENVQVRITTKSSSIDIAYVAIVDDEAEARDLIDAALDTTYEYYADWASDGIVKNSTDGSVNQ